MMIKTMGLVNKKIICNMYVADSFLKRLLGYMFRKVPHYEAIMITPCNSIHTFFMKFDIDVIFLNKQMEVIKKIEGLIPGKMIMPIKDSHAVIEVEAGVFKDMKVGDKITMGDV